MGTWHIVNAILLALLIGALIGGRGRNRKRPGQ
jgi:hypothetical protein